MRASPIRPALLLSLLLLCAGGAGCGYSFGDIDILADEPEPFSREALNFIVVGDWGRCGWFRQDNVARSMGRFAEENAVRFLISTGDNFYSDGVESVTDPQWESSYEEIYTDPSLYVPWYVVLGNHDYLGSVQAQIDYTERSDRWTLPARYYAIEQPVDDTTEALFLFLDTVALVEGGEAPEAFVGQATWGPAAQLRWVDSTLAASDADWRFVVGHHPLYSAAAKHDDSPLLRRLLVPLLEQHGVEAYLCGHVHSLQHLKPEGPVHYFVSGAGSLTRRIRARPYMAFAARTSGFMAASLTGDRLYVRFFDSKGRPIYATEVAPRPAPTAAAAAP